MKENSRRQRALTELEYAETCVAKAISLLGGYTRVTVPKKNPSTFVARKMLEGVSLRLHAIVNLLNYGERPKAELNPARSIEIQQLPHLPNVAFTPTKEQHDKDQHGELNESRSNSRPEERDSLDSNSGRPRGNEESAEEQA